MRRIVTAALAVGLLVVAPATALADDENPPPGVPGHIEFSSATKYVQYLGKRENMVDTATLLGKCVPDTPGQKCQLTKTDTYSREVSAEFGVTAEAVSTSIGISETQSVAIAIGCFSPEMKPTEEYVGYPTETRYYYKVITQTPDVYTDYGDVIYGERSESPVAYTAEYDKGVRCTVRPQPSS